MRSQSYLMLILMSMSSFVSLAVPPASLLKPQGRKSWAHQSSLLTLVPCSEGYNAYLISAVLVSVP